MKKEVASMDEKLVLISLKDRDNTEIENLFTQKEFLMKTLK